MKYLSKDFWTISDMLKWLNDNDETIEVISIDNKIVIYKEKQSVNKKHNDIKVSTNNCISTTTNQLSISDLFDLINEIDSREFNFDCDYLYIGRDGDTTLCIFDGPPFWDKHTREFQCEDYVNGYSTTINNIDALNFINVGECYKFRNEFFMSCPEKTSC